MNERMMLLVFQLGIILLAAYVGGRLSKRLGVPSVLGELLAGMVIGPYALGGIQFPLLSHGLFPVEGVFPVSPEMYGFTTFASILLLFLVGLETDLRLFFQYMAPGLVVGAGGALVSFVFGDLTTVYFYRLFTGADISFMDPAPLFLGVISSATSVGISARILSERKTIESPEGVTILSGAVIDDVLGVLLLAVVVGIVQVGHVEWTSVAWLGSTATGMLMVVIAVGIFLTRFFHRHLARVRDGGLAAILSLAAALIVAALFEHAGLAMIVGAYVVGLVFSNTPLKFEIHRQLTPFYRFFVPVFFCVMGMLVDFSAMTDPTVLTFGAVYTGTAVAAKLLGCGLPTLFMGYTVTGATRVGLGMLPRGEVALIIAAIALSMNAIPKEYFAAAMVMTVATTLIAPYLLVMALRINKPGVRHAKVPGQPEQRSLFVKLPGRDTIHLLHSQLNEALEAQDFETHVLDLETNLYRVRNHIMTFTMQIRDDGILFECDDSDTPLISALLFEIFVNTEQTMKALQQSAPKDLLRHGILDPGVKRLGIDPIDPPPEGVEVDLRGKTRRIILTELLQILESSGSLDPARMEDVLDSLLEREETMSTGMEHGIALPHARTDAVDRLVYAVGIHKTGIDFDAVDHQLCHIIVLTLVPWNQPGLYLQFVAATSRFLADEYKRQEILDSPDNEALYVAWTSRVVSQDDVDREAAIQVD